LCTYYHSMPTLLSVVRSVTDCPSAQLIAWDERPVEYSVYLPGRALVRISGTARCGDSVLNWSVVRKTGAPAREVRAYEAAWLAAAGFRPATCYLGDGNQLWLEDLSDRYGHRWPLEGFEAAAAALGRFNGAHLMTPPEDEAWLSRDWIEKHQDPPALARRPADLPVQSALRRALTALPQTICHHDAAQANLFLVGRDVVAIDWEGVGWGSVGADLATLVVGTMRRGDFPATGAAELDTVAFAGYARGLAEAGWRGNPAVARLGYSAAVGLRWPILAAAPASPLARFVQARTEEAGCR
jgi:hypothetical protein